ncbi:4-phosphoerythronate dehydrogenase [Pseudomonadota bacterium]
MKIIVDQNVTDAENTFALHGDVIPVDGRHLERDQLESADALIIRSVTKVNAGLLDNTPVRFVGTASIGTDHLDIPWLEQEGIKWASAPGCNADSAAQYTLAMIWLACLRLGRNPAGLRVGIIGRGNVGLRVQRLLNTIGATTVANDPPQADRGEPGLVSLDEALEQDIVCLHVPLTRDGPYPTWRFIDQRALARLPNSALLLNTARGNAVDGNALLAELLSGRLQAALDVWPTEPLIDGLLLDKAIVATPHVAGYSNEGRRNGSLMVYRAFCDWAGEPPLASSNIPGDLPKLTIGEGDDTLSKALDASCFVKHHDQAMRNLLPLTIEQRAVEFDQLRRNYPYRRDFHAWQVSGSPPESLDVLRRLGFSVTAKDGSKFQK